MASHIPSLHAQRLQEYMTLLHSCFVIGVPFALISAYSTPYELLHSLRTARPTRIFVHPSLFARAIAAAKNIGCSPHHIYLLEGNIPGMTTFSDLLLRVRQEDIPRVPIQPVKKNTLAYLVFSSGTSGLPKGKGPLHSPSEKGHDISPIAVMISHGNLSFTLAAFMVYVQAEMKLQAVSILCLLMEMSLIFYRAPSHHHI